MKHSSPAVLHLLCGKIASGKSTLARQLAEAHGSVLISEDQWLAGLYPEQIHSIADYLLHAGERTHNLDELARKYLGHENISITDLIGKGKKQCRMDQVEVARVAEYAGEDADATWRIEQILTG